METHMAKAKNGWSAGVQRPSTPSVEDETYAGKTSPQAKTTKPTNRPTNINPAIGVRHSESQAPTRDVPTHLAGPVRPVPQMDPASTDGVVTKPNTKSDSGWFPTVNEWETD
jgi:hypothetical protein